MALKVELPGRVIAGSGVVVLEPTDRQIYFNLDGMAFGIHLFPTITRDPLTTEFKRRHLKHVDIHLRGYFPLFTASWKLTGIAFSGDDRIDLDLIIFSQGDQLDCVRQATFTFTIVQGVGAPSREEMGLA